MKFIADLSIMTLNVDCETHPKAFLLYPSLLIIYCIVFIFIAFSFIYCLLCFLCSYYLFTNNQQSFVDAGFLTAPYKHKHKHSAKSKQTIQKQTANAKKTLAQRHTESAPELSNEMWYERRKSDRMQTSEIRKEHISVQKTSTNKKSKRSSENIV